MSTEDNKVIVRRFYDEAINKKNLVAIDEFVDPNVIDHSGLPGGIEGVKQLFSMTLTAYPDLHLTLEDEIAEGDKGGNEAGNSIDAPSPPRSYTVSSEAFTLWQ